MVPFNNPIGYRLIHKRHPGSQMNSPRERTATGKQWEISGHSESQLGHFGIALQRMQNEIGKLRRRIVGGGGSTASTGMVFKGEWDSAKSYDVQNVVAFTPEGGYSGLFIALKKNSRISPDTGNPNWFAFPTNPAGIWA